MTNYLKVSKKDYGVWATSKEKEKEEKPDKPDKPDKPKDKDTGNGKNNGKKNGNNPKTVAALKAAATAVGQFTQNRKVDYSGINSSSRGSAQETDLTAPGYSDYFARDNNGPV